MSHARSSDVLPDALPITTPLRSVQHSATGPHLRHAAYDHIKELIVSNELPPGQRLTIDDLVRRLGFGRTPVREALLRLQSEHLVEILPQRAIRIVEITSTQVRELFSVRELLECAAVEHASQAIPVALLDQLDAQFAAAGKQLDDGVYELYALPDLELHTQVRLHSGNSVLTALLELIHDRCKRVRVFAGVYGTGGGAREALAEHLGIVDALRRREAATARFRLAEHLRRSTIRILERLEASPADDASVPTRHCGSS